MISERARQGGTFGAAAQDCDRGRPGWPPAVLDAVAAALNLAPEATVLEVPAGAGRLTGSLARRFARVIAVEPLAAMRDLPAAHLPQVELRDGTAERLPVGDGEADAVFVAEASFDAPRALAEASRVLRPAGGIVLLPNTPAGPCRPPLPDKWREAFAGSAFGDPRRLRSRAAVPDRSHRRPPRAEMYVYWAGLAAPRWCDHCGGAFADGSSHAACAAARALEPPRYCPHCRRRMKVQVLPGGWTATCVVHGDG